MKKLFLISSLFALLAGCGGGNNSLTIDVPDGASYNDYINNVQLLVAGQSVARADWTGKAITLDLPAELPQDIEWAPDYFLQFLFSTEDINMTNEDIKVVVGTLEAYNAYDNRAGWIDYLADVDGERTKLILLFADSNSTISGESENFKFNVPLKKGWNKVYLTIRNSGRPLNVTTETPDLEMVWKPFI